MAAGGARAQSPQCPCTCTLTQEQRAPFQSMHGSAATYAAIRAGTSRSTLDADAYEALRAQYDAPFAEIAKQDRDAAKKREDKKNVPGQTVPAETP